MPIDITRVHCNKPDHGKKKNSKILGSSRRTDIKHESGAVLMKGSDDKPIHFLRRVSNTSNHGPIVPCKTSQDINLAFQSMDMRLKPGFDHARNFFRSTTKIPCVKQQTFLV